VPRRSRPHLESPALPFTIDTCLFEWVGGRLAGMTFTGDCLFRIIESTTIPNFNFDPSTSNVGWSANGTSKRICTGVNFTAETWTDPGPPPKVLNQPAWALGPGTSVIFRGCSLGELTVVAGATADIRSSECLKLNGPGAVNRGSLYDADPTTNAPYSVTFPVPFPDAAYSVSLQLTAPPTGSTGIPVFLTWTLKHPRAS